MKYAIRGMGAVLALAIIYLTTAFFVPAVRLGPVYAPTYALAIHLGLVDVKTVDWGYLKLRAGDAGITALRWLEHNSAPQIAQVSVAVQAQWFEAGHVFGGGHLIPEWTQTQETRFNDLRMPPDAKQFPTALTSGQVIPASFWRDQRFRLCRNGGNCTLRMVDMTGDSLPEVIVEFYMTGTQGMYAKPVVFTSWTVYRKVSERWSEVSNIWPCEVEHTTATGRMTVSDQKPDTPWINRQAVNFFPAECFTSALTTDAPALEKNAAAKNIKTMDTYPLLPASKPFPPSLKSALANRQVDLPLQGWPPLAFDGKTHIRVQRLPPCFTAPVTCVVMVSDINHDGRDDVIVFDAEIRNSGRDKYRIASLLMESETGWQVVNHHAICATTPFEKTTVEFKRPTWRAVEFAGRLILPEEQTEGCSEAFKGPTM